MFRDSTDTSNVLCDLEAEGMQQLIYQLNSRREGTLDIDDTLPYRYAWSCSVTTVL